jgi:pathogenesis-related protein 1
MKRPLIALVFSFLLILAAYIASAELLASKKAYNYQHPNCADTTKAIAQSDRPLKSNSNIAINGSISIGSDLTVQEVQQLIGLHNKVRSDVGVGPVTWSKKLAIYAQAWANNLASIDCDLRHRPRSGKWKQEYGENLFIGTSGYYGVADAVKFWESEKIYYQGQTLDSSNYHDSGHYTQIVWKTTEQIGCAKAECNSNLIVVCNYNPPGNVLGQKPY